MEFITEHFSAFLTMGIASLGALLLRISAQKYAEKDKKKIRDLKTDQENRRSIN